MPDSTNEGGSRRTFIKGAGAAAVAGLAGCGGSDTTTEAPADGEDGNDATETATETESMGNGTDTDTVSQEVTTLQLRVFSDTKKEEFINEYLNPKMKKDIGVEVEYETIGWGDGRKVQNNSITSGSGPDVEEIASTWMPKQAESGGWMDLTEAGVELNQDGIYDSPLDVANYNGTLTGFPWFWGPRANLYYDSMFKNAGIDGAPGTWDEMVQDAKKFNTWADEQASGGFQQKSLFGVPGANNWAVTQYYMMFLWSNGGQVLNEDNTKAVFNSDAAVKALNFYKNLSGKNSISPRAAVEWNGVARNNAFGAKRIASTFADIGVGISTVDNASDVLTAGTPPAGPNGEPSTFYGVNLMGIHPWTNKSDAAADFIEYLARPEVNAELNRRRGFLPTVKESFQAEGIADNELFQEFKGILEETNAKTAPAVVGWGGVSSAMKNAITTVLTKAATNSWSEGDTKKALDSAVTQANNSLE